MSLEKFREILVEHSRNPRNVGEIPSGLMGECSNPICGDKVVVSLKIGDSRIVEVKIKVMGCTMCTASASLMSDHIAKKEVQSVLATKKLFEESLFTKAESVWPEDLSDLVALSHLRVNRARVPCALISWIALQRALEAGLPS